MLLEFVIKNYLNHNTLLPVSEIQMYAVFIILALKLLNRLYD